MLAFFAETTRPPAYPFIIINVKERTLKQHCRKTQTDLSRPTVVQRFPPTSLQHLSAAVNAVKGYLGNSNSDRKSKIQKTSRRLIGSEIPLSDPVGGVMRGHRISSSIDRVVRGGFRRLAVSACPGVISRSKCDPWRFKSAPQNMLARMSLN